MHLYLGTNPIQADINYPVSALNQLEMTWDANPRTLYTLIMYDIDAPRKSFVHLLITNIPGNKIQEGKVLASFMLPSPLRGSGDHRYIFDLYEQSGPIMESSVESRRKTFKVRNFVSENNLKSIETDVLVVNPDTMQFHLRNSHWQVSFNPLHPLIKKGVPDDEAKFCSCVVKVAVKNPEECNLNQTEFGTKGCYNPYAVCASRVGTTSRNCYANYNFDEFSATELHALANLNGITVNPETSRESVISMILAKH